MIYADLVKIYKRPAKNNIIKEFLRRGGLRCEIFTSGTINIGDKITSKHKVKYETKKKT